MSSAAATGVSCRVVSCRLVQFVRSTMSRKLATIFSLLYVFYRLSLADNETANTQDGVAQPRPIDKGLEPLYIMTETFLDIVHPPSRGDALSDPRFDAGNCNCASLLTDLDTAYSGTSICMTKYRVDLIISVSTIDTMMC